MNDEDCRLYMGIFWILESLSISIILTNILYIDFKSRNFYAVFIRGLSLKIFISSQLKIFVKLNPIDNLPIILFKWKHKNSVLSTKSIIKKMKISFCQIITKISNDPCLMWIHSIFLIFCEKIGHFIKFMFFNWNLILGSPN